MARPTLPADGVKPWGTILRNGIYDVSDRTDTALTNALSALSAANSAVSTANSAQSTANNANSSVTSLQTTVSNKADDNAVVKLTGNQTIAGIKTFSSAPAVPDGSFTIAKTSGLQAALDSKLSSGNTVDTTTNQSIAGIKTFTSAPVVPDNSFAIAKVSGLQTQLNNLASGAAIADNSITNVKISSSAAISADKLANGTTNVIMTSAERSYLAALPTQLANTNLTYTAAAALSSRPSVPTGMKIRIYGGSATDADPTWMADGDYRDLTV